jgi:hypothetical protein
MPHFYRVLKNAKNKEYDTLRSDEQPLANMPHLPNIKMEFSYIIFVMQVRCKWVLSLIEQIVHK